MIKKIFLIALSFVTVTIIAYFVYASIVTTGSQRMPTINVPNELEKFKKELETDKIEIVFYELSEVDLKKCKGKQEISLRLSEDSISKSKKTLDDYVNSINKKINERLVNKKCIDSLIITVSSYYSKETVDSLKSKNYRYSFPINKQNLKYEKNKI